MASDGIWDNLFDYQVKTCIKKQMSCKKKQGKNKIDFMRVNNLQKAADCLALEAEELGTLEGYLSPFAKEAKKEYLDFEPRGKADDVTVIVAQIFTRNKPSYYSA